MKTIYIILLLVPILIQSANVETNREPTSVVENSEKVKRKCHNESLWRRMNNLKQWKRRRRVFNFSPRLLFDKTENYYLRVKRRAIEFDDKEQFSYDYVETENGPDAKVLPTSSLFLIARFKDIWPVKQWRRYGFFTDEYLLSINSHWLQFPPPNSSIQYGLGGLYIVMMIIGCSGNALVLVMYFRCRSLRTPGNILVANLALSDFFMLAKTPVFVFNSFNLGPALGKTGCVIYGFLGGLTGTTSIATLSAIALDRYWAVVRPLEPLRALTAIRARILAIGAWIYACGFSIIPALDFGYGHYVPEGYLTSCSFDYLTDEMPPKYFIFVFFCAAWLTPLCTISFCYISIFRVVTYDRNIVTKNQEHRMSSRHVKEQAKRKAEIKLAFLVIVVIALFFISWTPYAVVALLGIFGRKDLITPLSSMIPALFCKTAACINPFIYIITHPNFRKEFLKLLCRDKAKRMGTMKSIGYTEANKVRRSSRLSDTDVEVIEMKDIPYNNEIDYDKGGDIVKTVSSRIERESVRSASMKSYEENVVRPPSWYAKPQFAKKKSFHRRSSRSIGSTNTDTII